MKKKLSFAFLLVTVQSCIIIAQNITGNIEGNVVDSTNSSLSGVNISLESKDLQGILGTASDDRGYFKIMNLPVGDYKVKISSIGYQILIFQNVKVQLERTTYLGKIQLNSQNINLPELIVSGERSGIDPNSTLYGSNLQSKDFENLPIDRNYQSMISLLPQSNTSYYGDGINIGGATGFENKYFVDGVEVTDPLIGASSTNLPYNFIKEVEVKAGGYEAEFQSALGGVVNVITNSGTNEFHGSFFGFYAGNGFAANKELGLLDPTQGNFSDYDAGFSLGGPILQDKLWFFTAYNPTFSNHEVSIPNFGTGVDRSIRHSFAAKLDWSALPQMKFNITLTGDPAQRKAVGRNILIPPAGLENPDPYLQDINEGGFNFSLNAAYSYQQNFLIQGLISGVVRHDKGEPSTERGNEVYFEDLTNNTTNWGGGVKSNWDSFRYSNILKVNVTLLTNDHTINAGVQYKVDGTDNNYNNHSITKYNDTTYVESIGKGFQTVSQRLPSVFVQDLWKIFSGFRVFAGIRWDGQYIIGSNNKIAQNVTVPLQPRLGIIFIPDKNGRNKIFGSYGRYSQDFGLFQSTGLYSDQGYIYNIIYKQDPLINKSGADTAYTSQAIFSEVNNLKGQYFDEFNLGYERLLGKNIHFTIQGTYRKLLEAIDNGYVYDEVNNQWVLIWGNLGLGMLNSFPRPKRDYKALIFTIEQHNQEHFNFQASYVISRNYGNYEGLFDAVNHTEFPNSNSESDNPFFAPVNTTGLLPNDRTNLFKFSGSYSFSFGLITGITFTAQSGTPLSDLWNTEIAGISFLSQRGCSGRTPSLWDLNARIIYLLPLFKKGNERLILDIFHIASKQKPVDINQFHYLGVDYNMNPGILNPDYGKPYRYQQPMSFRLGMEVSF